MATFRDGQPVAQLINVRTSGCILTEESLVRLRDNPYDDSDLSIDVYGDLKGDKFTRAMFNGQVNDFWVWAYETWDKIGDSIDELDISRMRGQWILPFLRRLGYDPVFQAGYETIEGPTEEQSIRVDISHRGWDRKNAVRIHSMLSSEEFDKANERDRNTQSPHEAMQRFLVLNDDVDWGILFNGKSIRLLKTYYHEYTRGFVEFDLDNILALRNLDEFRLLYMILHANVYRGNKPIDKFYERSQKTGIKIGDKLRDNVKLALEELGNDLLTPELRSHYEENPEEIGEFFTQLLRVFYRIMFILYAEQREMLPSQETLYGREYSITKLRGLAEKQLVPDDDVDLWRGLQRTFKLIEDNKAGDPLEVYTYNGSLFSNENTSIINSLSCRNSVLLHVIRLLTTTDQDGVRNRISYIDIDVEEIGSVYESLLDYEPRVLPEDRIIGSERYSAHRFYLMPRGLERKSTGSYYTDKGLVNILVKTALVPVVNEKLKAVEEISKDADPSVVRLRKREALLDVKVVDPACGGGTFLIAALDYLGLRLAQIDSDSEHPSDMALREARREVLMHCIYGVDLNPLAVELAKISLWLHASVKNHPLTFLDHRIKCGNSLIGANKELIADGINPEAFTPLKRQKSTGIKPENRQVANALKKYTRDTKKAPIPHTIGSYFVDDDITDYVNGIKRLDLLNEDTPNQINTKAEYYEMLKADQVYERQKLIYDTWISSYFWDLTDEYKGLSKTRLDKLCPTETAFRDVCSGLGLEELKQKVKSYSKKYRFFNWDIEFPDVFYREDSGFDCILTNPPWDVWKLEEEEFFSGKKRSIEEKKRQSERRKEIKKLLSGSEKDRQLHNNYASTWASYFKTSNFFSKSGLYTLSAKGQLNTYQLFVERCWGLLSSKGRTGMVVPTGIVTGYYLKDLFASLVETNSLVSLFDFENTKQIFPIHRQFRFSLLTISGKERESSPIPMSFLNHLPSEVETQLTKIPEDPTQIQQAINSLPDDAKLFAFTREDFETLNPNTLTCPIFSKRKDAELTKHLYKQAPVLIKRDRETNEIKSNPWEISFSTLFHMSNDSEYFLTIEDLRQLGAKPEKPQVIGGPWSNGSERYLPLYEGKMIWYYDHRYNSVIDTTGQQGTGQETTLQQHQDPEYFPTPRYWVKEIEVKSKISKEYEKKWFIGFRDITNVTNERTFVTTLIPRYGVGNKLPLIITENTQDLFLLQANLSSIVFDYITRQKLAGTSMNYFYVEQFPVLNIEQYPESIKNKICDSVVELNYTSKYLESFASDYGYNGIPFTWKEQRREFLKSELDAIYAYLYKISKNDLEYILEQFPVLKKNEINQYGEYRTKRLILETYDRLKPELGGLLDE